MRDALSAIGENNLELERLRAALAAAGDILYTWDFAVDRVSIIGGAADVLGIPDFVSGIKAESFERRLDPQDIPARRMALLNHMTTRQRYECEYRVRTMSGEVRWVHDRGAATFDAAGKPVRMYGILRVSSSSRARPPSPGGVLGAGNPSGGYGDNYRREIEIFEEVRSALSVGRLVFAYQPVVMARTNDVAFYECLMRLEREDGELVAAGDFIPLAEQLGFIRAIDRRALELAVADLALYRHVILALNISSITVFDRSWQHLLTSLVKGRPDIAERLIVEITETAAIPDIEEMARFVSALRSLGCKIALDDFGAGYTSFRYLKSLAVDIVKIDGAFVRNISENPANRHLVRTLLGLAEGFGLGTVAECVETEADARLLAAEGVDYLQGWHFGMPVAEPDWRIRKSEIEAPAAHADYQRLQA